MASRTILLQIWLLLTGVSQISAIQCDVKDYGAKGDGENNDTDAFIKAFQACTENGICSYVFMNRPWKRVFLL